MIWHNDLTHWSDTIVWHPDQPWLTIWHIDLPWLAIWHIHRSWETILFCVVHSRCTRSTEVLERGQHIPWFRHVDVEASTERRRRFHHSVHRRETRTRDVKLDEMRHDSVSRSFLFPLTRIYKEGWKSFAHSFDCLTLVFSSDFGFKLFPFFG